MKIWNGYIKNWIDLEKYPVNKSTWKHGFFTGYCVGLLAMLLMILVILI